MCCGRTGSARTVRKRTPLAGAVAALSTFEIPATTSLEGIQLVWLVAAAEKLDAHSRYETYEITGNQETFFLNFKVNIFGIRTKVCHAVRDCYIQITKPSDAHPAFSTTFSKLKASFLVFILLLPLLYVCAKHCCYLSGLVDGCCRSSALPDICALFEGRIL
jgi:hypothetical protein